MKKLFLMTIVVLLGFFAFSIDTYAACGVSISVGDESICFVTGSNESNSSGTAYVENGVLVLKNYNGGNITFASGLGDPATGITIKLVGDNYITNENGYGILAPVTGLSFVGDGTLTVKSKTPFVSAEFDRREISYLYGDNVTTVKITAGEVKREVVDNKETVDDTTIIDNTTSTDNTSITDDTTINDEVKVKEDSDSGLDLTTILLIVSSIISVLCLIIVVVLLLNNKKNKK